MQKNDRPRIFAQARYRVFLFGRMRLECVEGEVATDEPCYRPYRPDGWDRRSPWRVLAYLLTRQGRRTYRDPLLDALWPDSPLERSQRACSIALSHVRQGLTAGGEALLMPRKADEHSLIHLADQEYIWCDWDAFTHLLTQAQLAEQQGDNALPLWEKAYALSRDEFLLGERYEDWCRGLRERTAGEQRLCLLRLAACYGQHGRPAEEECLLRQFLSTFPHDEDMLSRLVALLIPQGRFQEALRWSQRTVEALRDEGLEVTAHTKTLLKQLQARQKASSFPLHLPQDILKTPVVSLSLPAPSPAEAALTTLFDRATQFVVTIFGLVSQWQGRATECATLQELLSKEFAMFEQDALPHRAGEDAPLSRRQALLAIAALPYGALAAAKLAGTEVAPEAFLPQATAAITSCWSIMQYRDFAAVKQAISHCLPALSALAQKSSPHQQVAASLAVQGNLLLGLVGYHQQPNNLRQQLLYRKQAVKLAEPLTDPTLRVLSLCHLGYNEGDIGNFSAMLEALEEARRLSEHELVSPTLRRKVSIEFAYAYARAGQAQQAMRHQGVLKTDLPVISEEVPVYLQDSGLFHEGLLESQVFEWLGRQAKTASYYQRAWKAIEEVEQPLSPLLVPERFRLEAINQKALVALRLGDLEQFSTLSLQGIQGARALQSEKRRQEIVANWKEARKVWPREPQILELADVLVE